MRLYVPLALGLSLLASGCAGTAGQPATASSASADASCPTTTESENVAIAGVWHEQAINQRDPSALYGILNPEVVHHAAGGYADTMTADGVVTMMADFPQAFSDLHYDFDLLFAKDDLVVERYTASGTQDGPLQDLPASGRKATWTGINIFRIDCGRIVEIWSEVDDMSRRQQLTGHAPSA